jgi:hypothetical protein
MGYPDNFKFEGDLRGMYRQNGNAVPPPMARAVALEIAKAARKSGLFDLSRAGRQTIIFPGDDDVLVLKPPKVKNPVLEEEEEEDEEEPDFLVDLPFEQPIRTKRARVEGTKDLPILLQEDLDDSSSKEEVVFEFEIRIPVVYL